MPSSPNIFVLAAIVLIMAFPLSMTACAVGEVESQEGEQDDDDHNDDDNDAGQNDPTQNDADNQNQEEPSPPLTQIHQWCAAAGQSGDGELTALHCSGPHDTSGFEASDGEHRWQPGAFQIVVE